MVLEMRPFSLFIVIELGIHFLHFFKLFYCLFFHIISLSHSNVISIIIFAHTIISCGPTLLVDHRTMYILCYEKDPPPPPNKQTKKKSLSQFVSICALYLIAMIIAIR